ncbi:MAG: hypothetical protein AAF108_08730 [Planctomycetota bacterium]
MRPDSAALLSFAVETAAPVAASALFSPLTLDEAFAAVAVSDASFAAADFSETLFFVVLVVFFVVVFLLGGVADFASGVFAAAVFLLTEVFLVVFFVVDFFAGDFLVVDFFELVVLLGLDAVFDVFFFATNYPVARSPVPPLTRTRREYSGQGKPKK